jgi:hypothetical protein
MEIDDLKAIWKNNDSFERKNEAQIALMLKGQSKSIVDKLKRNVWFEIVFTLVSGLLLLFYALTLENGALKWTSISILILFGAYSFYYVKKLMLLSRFDSGNENIKDNLEALVTNLSSYLKFYKRSYTILYPAYFVLSLLFVAMERGMDEFVTHLMKSETILYLIALAGAFYLCCTWLVDWFLKKLYGNHLTKLKRLLAELESPALDVMS